MQVSEPGECGQCYTDQTNTFSSCVSGFPGGITSPCYETDSASSLYSTQFGSTFYDSQGRAVETTVPGPAPASPKTGKSYFTVTMTTYDDQQGSSWQSLPFVVAVPTNPSGPTGTGWLYPATITDYTGTQPGGTAVYRDALGRTITTQDPMIGSQQEPGINCPNLPSWLQQLNLTYTTCAFYGLGQAQGDSATYSYTGSIDPNNHVSVSFANMMGWTLYTQRYNGTYSGPGIGNISGNLIQQQAVTDNILGEPVTITTTDEKTNQSITVTMHYDDLGQMTSESDPETNSYTYTYDPDGNLLSAVSGTRTLGYNYDLMGRIGCVQDATPTLDADGSCTSGTHPYLQYIYDSDKIGGTSYPIGRLTKTVATTYYPDSGTPSASATEKYAYDTRGRLTTEQLLFNLPSAWNVTNSLPTYQMSYAYNDDDQLYSSTSSTGVNGNFTTQYSTTQIYDQTTGVPTGLGTTSSTPTLGTLTYNNSALPNTLTYLSTGGNPLINETFSYDGNLRLTGASACWQSTGCNNTGGTIFSQSRGFDVASNVTSAVTQLAGVPGVSSPGKETQIFCYDAQNRLVWAGNSGTVPSPGNGTCGTGTPGSTLSEGSYQNAYSYGHFDQLIQGPFGGTQGQQYLYCNSGTPHQLTGIYASSATCSNKSGKVYGSSYDSWGNVVTRTLYNEAQPNPATLSYDLLNHFIEWQDTDPNTNITTSQWNLYDANGERVLQRSTNNGTTTLIAYPFGNEEYHYTAGGTLQNSLHYDDLGGQLLDERSGSATTMLLTDALGSVISTFSNTQGSAAVLGNQLYDPYGNQRLQAGTIDNSTSRGFTGQDSDSVTGLDYYGARYYDPAAGVFLAADSMQGNAVSMNPYGYVGGNPETMTDPTGNYTVPNDQGVSGEMADLSYEIPDAYYNAFEDDPYNLLYPDETATTGNTTYSYNSSTGDLSRTVVESDGTTKNATFFPTDAGYQQQMNIFNGIPSNDGLGHPVNGSILAEHGIQHKPGAGELAAGSTSSSQLGQGPKPQGGGSGKGNGSTGNKSTAPSPDEPNGKKTPPDLYRGGNATGPRVDKVRVSGDPEYKTYDVHPDENGDICSGEGISTFNKPGPGKGWWRLPAGTELPEGLQYNNDTPNHWLIEPSVPMSVDTFKHLLEQITGWERCS